MPSWVRYSVAAYLGFLLAGSIMWTPSTTAGSDSQRDRIAAPTPELRDDVEGMTNDE